MRNTLLIILSVILIGTGCRRDDDFQRDSDTESARDHALAERSFEEIQSIGDQAEQGSLGNFREMNDTIYLGCATIIRDTTVNPKTITVDFGTTNCTCQDGRTRRGKIITTYTGTYRDSGTVITHTPDNYFVNDYQITGSKTVTNQGRNTSGNLWYSISVTGNVIKPNGGTITWNSTRQREWIAGETTSLIWQDDIYLITGSANGTSAAGNVFTALITQALQVELNCPHITQGILEFTPSNRPVRYINFGNGTCDNLATVTINGNTYNVTLY